MISSSYGVKNVAVAFNLILKLVERNLVQLQEGYETIDKIKQYVHIGTIIGRQKIPATAANTLRNLYSAVC